MTTSNTKTTKAEDTKTTKAEDTKTTKAEDTKTTKAEDTKTTKATKTEETKAADHAIAEPEVAFRGQTTVGKDGVERIVSTIPDDGWEPAPVEPDKDEVARMKKFNADQKKNADERNKKDS